MANRLFQAFIDTAKNIAGYPITVANAVFMRDGSTLDEFSENIPHREDDEDTNIEVPNIDADMLNGHPADYYAKQSDLSALNNSVTQVNNKIGNTDVSKWGNSLTGAIKAACDKSDANEKAIADVNSNLLYRGVYSGQILIPANGYNNAIIGRDELGINNNNYIIYANVHQQYFESASTANINIEIGYVISEDNRINLSFYNNTTSDRLFAYQVEVLFRENKP